MRDVLKTKQNSQFFWTSYGISMYSFDLAYFLNITFVRFLLHVFYHGLLL